MLSAVIITKNADPTLADCLESLAFVDEIVILDSSSDDDTLKIANSFGAKVQVTTNWPGFGPQKNHALAYATHEWVLSIDADEVVSASLKDEILKTIKMSKSDTAYEIVRVSQFCGKFIRYSGWQNDRVLRLFRRGTAKFSNDLVHERVITSSKVVCLESPLYHFSFHNFEQTIEKMNKYSTASAQQLYSSGKKSSVHKALLHAGWAFIRTYIIRLGVLDGSHGLALAIANAEGTYYRYVKLWYLSSRD